MRIALMAGGFLANPSRAAANEVGQRTRSPRQQRVRAPWISASAILFDMRGLASPVPLAFWSEISFIFMLSSVQGFKLAAARRRSRTRRVHFIGMSAFVRSPDCQGGRDGGRRRRVHSEHNSVQFVLGNFQISCGSYWG